MPTLFHLYIIRHKATNEVMPQMKKNRGYTSWNPICNDYPEQALDIPRLLTSKKQAKMVINQWFNMPNAHYEIIDEDYNICFKDDGRKKEDLEIVMVEINESPVKIR